MDDTLYAGLSPAQARVALSLASGASLSHAARSSGVGRTTIYAWLKDNPHFSAAIEHAKMEYIATLRDRVRDLSAKALDTLDAILDDPSVHPSVRLKAALAVLNRPHFPDQGWHLPEKTNHPGDEQALETLAQLEFSHRQARYAQTVLDHIVEAGLAHPPTSPEPRTHPDTSEQQTQPVRPTPRPSRNEPCPCGSGLKFKRCCLNKPRPSSERSSG
ncbi:MAG: hypothetical protein IANPNBLG_03618 [Bryobacteraceae bacterium]|nr:hypothetical protein [Bryobacteraceae bacterium]